MSQLTSEIKHIRLRKRIDKELQHLRELFGCGWNLGVRWLPGGSDSLAAEVRDDIILIYEEDPVKAISVLRHEFLDYLVCKAVKPYQDLINVQRTTVNAVLKELQEEAHREKEKIVEKLKAILEAHKTKTRLKLSGPNSLAGVSDRKHTSRSPREGGRI